MTPSTQDARATGLVEEAPKRSLMDRAPKDLKIMWQGGTADQWTIRIEATITDADQADSLRELIRILSDASKPALAASTKDMNHDG